MEEMSRAGSHHVFPVHFISCYLGSKVYIFSHSVSVGDANNTWPVLNFSTATTALIDVIQSLLFLCPVACPPLLCSPLLCSPHPVLSMNFVFGGPGRPHCPHTHARQRQGGSLHAQSRMDPIVFWLVIGSPETHFNLSRKKWYYFFLCPFEFLLIHFCWYFLNSLWKMW